MTDILTLRARRRAHTVLGLFILSQALGVSALAEEEKGAYNTQVPPGMELKKVGNKDSYRVVVPKGTSFRRQGDLRIVEGSGEYLSRALLDYDARLEKMNSTIEALKKDVEEIKNSIADIRKSALASKER